MNRTVTLSEQTTTNRQGKSYNYWVLRWFGSDGKRYGKTIGRVDQMSRRQAEKLRRQKEAELETNPGRRDVSRSPVLGEFLERYYADRKTELGPGTMELHRQTGRYLTADRQRIAKFRGSDDRHHLTALNVRGNRQRPRGQVSVNRSTTCRPIASGRAR
jgi:hypothetical protein